MLTPPKHRFKRLAHTKSAVNQLSLAAISFGNGTITMRNKLMLISILFALSGCSYLHVHKMDVEQGNVITQEMVGKLHTGQTEAQVKAIMGTPILTNVFDKSRLDYVYTYKPGYGEGNEHYITIIFTKGRLSAIKGNLYSEFVR